MTTAGDEPTYTIIGHADGHDRELGLTTRGLEAQVGFELHVGGVPPFLDAEGRLLLTLVAERLRAGSSLVHGATWLVPLAGEGFSLAVRATRRGWGAGGAATLSLGDPCAPGEPARSAVAGLAVAEALGRARRGARDAALEHLHAVVDWYPGRPSPLDELDGTEPHNANNALAWLALALLGDDSEADYVRALERSVLLQETEAGGALSPPLHPAAALVEESQRLVAALHTHDETLRARGPGIARAQAGGGGIAFLTSPFVTVAQGEPYAQVAVGPPELRRAFHERPARAVFQQPEVHALAAELYLAGAADPVRALLATREVAMSTWEFGFRFDELTPLRPVEALRSPRLGVLHLPLLSRVLASLGRDIAAGLAPAEVRARWDVAPHPAHAAAAVRKLDAFARSHAEFRRRSFSVRALVGQPGPGPSPSRTPPTLM